MIYSYVAGLALTAAANVCSESMARDIFSDVLAKMSSSNPFIKKKACLCMINILNKIPEMIEDVVKALPTLLSDEDHGVLISGKDCFLTVKISRISDPVHTQEESRSHSQVPQAHSSSEQEIKERY